MKAASSLAVTFASLCLLAPTPRGAMAQQYEVGTGNMLDAGLSRYLQGPNTNFNAMAPNFYSGNNVITRNVVAGRGFRGAVGYGAADDFRGATGSDELFGFRADSALSDVSFLNYGNTFDRLRFGQDIGMLDFRRSAAGQTLPTVIAGIRNENDVLRNRLRLDEIVRASSLTESNRMAAEPRDLGLISDKEDQLFVITVSSLQGIAKTPFEELVGRSTLSTFDVARLYQDAVQGYDVSTTGTRFGIDYSGIRQLDEAGAQARGDETNPLLRGPRMEADRMNTRIEPQTNLGYLALQEEIARRYTDRYNQTEAAVPIAIDDPTVIAAVEEDIERVRQYLISQGKLSEDGSDADLLRAPFLSEWTDEEMEAAAGERDEELQDPLRIEVEGYGLLLQHGQRIDSLSSTDQTRFNELVISGEERLLKGEYFWAERHFTRALRFTPGHPLATVGAAHAQLGAGLYLSASLTLRSLFKFQPEMIDANYDPRLVPNRPRLLKAIEMLQERLANPRDRASNAFLLAYVGRLIDDRKVIEQGLSIMAEEALDERLVQLLRTVWLDGGRPPKGDATPVGEEIPTPAPAPEK